MTLLDRATSLTAGFPRPLDPIRSIKLKISILLLASGAAGLVYLWLEFRWVPPVPTALVTVAIVLLTAQLLGHGMTRPLREMTAAARSMAQGDYTRRVRATSGDEVGELATAFNKMAADLAAADQQRRELIANVSHELRTPIAALQAVLENVVDGVAAPDPATLRTALAQTERLGRLTTELLDLSMIDAGALPLATEVFELAPLLNEAVAEVAVAAEVAGRRVRFAVEVSPPDATVCADRGRLHQVVVNLLDNAARHGPPGTDVWVLGRRDGAEVVLEVRDAGPGIAPADRGRVFDRFTRGERAAGGGTGLGLAIARWAVDLHGGRIAVVEPPEAPAADAPAADGGLLAVPVAALRALPWLGRAPRSRDVRPGLRIAASLLVGLGLLTVFGPLLASADAAFARVSADLLPTVDGGWVTRWVVLFVLFGAVTAGACHLLVAPPAPADPRAARPSRLRGIEWTLPVGLLVVLFALFVGVHFATLFGGDAHVRRVTGLTYAEYARSGFGQLLLVTALTLVVVAIASRIAPVRSRAQRARTRMLLGALAVLALVIVASAISRLWLYQQAYGFTELRLLALTCELWLGAGLVLALVMVLRLRTGGLARAVVAAGVVALLSLAVLDPGRFVAEHNIARFAETGRIDTDYLAELPADAVPALTALPEPLRSCALAPAAARLGPADAEEWRSWNVARARARAVLADAQLQGNGELLVGCNLPVR